MAKWGESICKKFGTDLQNRATKFDKHDPCINCGYRLEDHPEVEPPAAKPELPE